MPLGIRPVIDFAFKKTFGSPDNKPCVVSLLNAVLRLPTPIVHVTIENPYNFREFEDDKSSILDVKARDANNSVCNIEMRLDVYPSLAQRLVYYSCELYADQFRAGDDYELARPTFTICFIDGVLWRNRPRLHHAFMFADCSDGFVIERAPSLHTLELGKYSLVEENLPTAGILDCWLFWLLRAQEYETEALKQLLPQPPIQQATEVLERIALVTEDKVLYDAREKARRDLQSAMNSKYREGEAKGLLEGEAKGRREGEIKLLRALQELVGVPVSGDEELSGQNLAFLQNLTAQLQNQLRGRKST